MLPSCVLSSYSLSAVCVRYEIVTYAGVQWASQVLYEDLFDKSQVSWFVMFLHDNGVLSSVGSNVESIMRLKLKTEKDSECAGVWGR